MSEPTTSRPAVPKTSRGPELTRARLNYLTKQALVVLYKRMGCSGGASNPLSSWDRQELIDAIMERRAEIREFVESAGGVTGGAKQVLDGHQ